MPRIAKEIRDKHRAFFAFAIIVYFALWMIIFGVFIYIMTPEAKAADNCLAYRSMVAREAQAVHGPDAPTPMFVGQIKQESSCRPGITAADLGRGIAQFMDGTTKQVASLFPELGPADPYNPRWAIRAMIRYDGWIYRRVKGKDECHRWGAALVSYNAGLGWVQRAQKASAAPEVWFDVTEKINPGQTAMNFTYSRSYPYKILLQHQKAYVSSGKTTCLPRPT